MLYCRLSAPDRLPPLSFIRVLFSETFTGNKTLFSCIKKIITGPLWD
jgi:hypothetical protein